MQLVGLNRFAVDERALLLGAFSVIHPQLFYQHSFSLTSDS